MNRRKELTDALQRAIAIHGRDDACAVLKHVNISVKNAHGIEAIYQGDDKPSCIYVNTGETYSLTALYDDRLAKFVVTTWGDWIEEQELNGWTYN